MNIKGMNSLINQILEQEAKKLIIEQIEDSSISEGNIAYVKKFQSLSGLVGNISDIEDIGDDNFGVIINMKNIDVNEFINRCGGSTFEEAQKNLMQGLHHDLEDNQLGDGFDIDIDSKGENEGLDLQIKITAGKNDLLGDEDMKENKENSNMDEKKEILLGGKKVCPECGKKIEEGDDMCDECNVSINNKNESTNKKIVTISETKMKELLKKVILEGVPGIETTKTMHNASGKQNSDALKAVEEKIRKYLSFEGNDNPEFPKPIGKGEKVARQNTPEQDEIVDDNRGRGPQDLDYDTDGIDNNEPLKKHTERIKKSLVGDSEMGNSQDAANVVKSKTGEKMFKNIERRQKNLKKEPIYPKEAVPVKTEKKEEVRPVNESVLKDIEKMKRMSSYDQKTQ